MKKVFFIAAVVAAAVFGVMKATDTNTSSTMSDLQMENVEALANGDDYAPCGCKPKNNRYCDCEWIVVLDFKRTY